MIPRTTHDNEEHAFWQALEILGRTRVKSGAAVRIGVKLLLTKNNAQSIEHRVKKLLDLTVSGRHEHVVDHIKVKSIRGNGVEPSAELVRDMEHKLALVKSRYGKRASDLQIDIKSAVVPGAYRCWISPIMSVIDASGDVYLCCNYYEIGKEWSIGTVGTETRFKDLWGEARHRAILNKDGYSAKVCNSRFGCHCRLVHFQEIAEPFISYSDLVTPVNEPFFAGHDKWL